MKILVFGLSSIHGGVESVILSFCRQALEKHVCEFDFVVIDEIPRFAQFLSDEYTCNFIIVPNRLRHPFGYRQGLKSAIMNGSYDLVWFNACTLSDIELLKIANDFNVRCVLHSHNSENMGNFMNKILHLVHKAKIDNYVDVYCACSSEAAFFMFPQFIYSDRNKWQFVRNGIPTQDFCFDPEKRNNIRKKYDFRDCILVGHVGRMHPQKNHIFILSIFEEFHNKYPYSKLLFFGEGSLEEELRTIVRQRNLDSAVFFMGVQENINDWLSALDAFLFPSLYEGLPVSLLEAQASGLPCLISDVISSAVICTSYVVRESLSSSALVWCHALEKLLKNQNQESRVEAWRQVESAGFDVEKESVNFFESLKKINNNLKM